MSKNKQEESKEQLDVVIETAENLEEPQKESEEDLTSKVISVKDEKEIVTEAAPEKVAPVVVTPSNLETVVGIPRSHQKKFGRLRRKY